MRFSDCAAADRRLLVALRRCGDRPEIAAMARVLSFAGEHGALWIAVGLTGSVVDGGRRGAWLRATALVGGAHVVSVGVKRVVRRTRPAAFPQAASTLAASTQAASALVASAQVSPARAGSAQVPAVRGPVAGSSDPAAPVILTAQGPVVRDSAVRGPVVRDSAARGPVVRDPAAQGPVVRRAARAPRAPVWTPLVRTASPYSFPSSHATSATAAAVAFGALTPGTRRIVAPLAAAVCVSRLVVGVHYPTDIAAGAVLGGLAARLGRHWAAGSHRHGRRAE